MRHFKQLINDRWQKGFFVCIGLDTDYKKIPEHLQQGPLEESIRNFNCSIIEATAGLAAAFKINVAFYEAEGPAGILALHQTIRYAQEVFPAVPIIVDSKRGDIGNSNEAYARAMFEQLNADAVTVSPYLGEESLKPFLARADKGIFVLCRTSNPGAAEFQGLVVENQPLHEIVAKHVSRHWNRNYNCGLVVGATYPGELQIVREIAGDSIPFLIPGVGAQGGDLEKTVFYARNSCGTGMIINASRSIIFASAGTDFADAAWLETKKLHDAIHQIYREKGVVIHA